MNLLLSQRIYYSGQILKKPWLWDLEVSLEYSIVLLTSSSTNLPQTCPHSHVHVCMYIRMPTYSRTYRVRNFRMCSICVTVPCSIHIPCLFYWCNIRCHFKLDLTLWYQSQLASGRPFLALVNVICLFPSTWLRYLI